jgi:hypothetical protein
VAEIEDGYECTLEPAEAAALILTDAIVQDTGALNDSQWDELREYYSDAEIAEIVLGVGLFHGMSKVLICLGDGHHHPAHAGKRDRLTRDLRPAPKTIRPLRRPGRESFPAGRSAPTRPA